VTDQPNPAPDEGAPGASHGDSEFQPAFDHPLTPRERMAIERAHMPEQDALARAANFHEVNLGYTEQLAILEAERCLQCKNPVCIDGCPVRVNIPLFIELLRTGDMAGAAASLLGDNALPCVTGRVCPQEIQCEGICVRAKKGSPVAIGALERYVADWAMAHPETIPVASPQASGKSVAVVGSGPSGLTAAGELVKSGHDVTVFEAFHAAGGVLIYGIPEFRLPKDIVQGEVDRLVASGVKIEANAIIGRTYTLHELRERFDAVFIAVGAGLPVFMNVPGENLKGVYSANEYLTRVNLMGAWNPESDTPILRGHRVVVVGGGNVAIDAVRTAKRLGAEEATIVYRRGKAELPARAEEVHHAEQEGIRFDFQVAPVEVLGDENRWVTGIRSIRMELGEPDASGRRRPMPIEGSEFEIECEMVVVAIGTRSNPLLTASEPDLEINPWGYIVTDEHGMTSVPGVFAGGDIVRGAATVILAMGDGKTAAHAIDAWLSGEYPPAAESRAGEPAGTAAE
jgi:glutamate synthase (NADPH/NADH) small chain